MVEPCHPASPAELEPLADYARERLGIAGSTALAMAQLARELRERPILREAVRRGEVTARRCAAGGTRFSATSLPARRTRHQQAIERDGCCQVPGCSRAAGQAHHVQLRSHGGSDDLGNLTGLCGAHHLHGVHRGLLRVRGRAPDRLRWELGVSARRVQRRIGPASERPHAR
jgi:hypothetical protein